MAPNPQIRGQESTADTLSALVGRYGPDLPLDEVLAVCAVDEDPSLRVDELLQKLDRFSSTLTIPDNIGFAEQFARLQYHLLHHHSLQVVETPTHVERALTDRQISPSLLACLTLDLARRFGIALHAIAASGVLVLKHAVAEPPFYIDFSQSDPVMGTSCLLRRLATVEPVALSSSPWADAVAPISNLQVAIRVNQEAKRLGMPAGDLPMALRAVERILALAPHHATAHRDRGLLLIRLGRVGEGLQSLDTYLSWEPFAIDGPDVIQLLHTLESSSTFSSFEREAPEA